MGYYSEVALTLKKSGRFGIDKESTRRRRRYTVIDSGSR